MKIETNFYTITSYANLYHLEVYSSWDDRVVDDYIKHRNEVVSRLYLNKKWGLLMDMRKWSLHTPEGEDMLTKFVKKAPPQKTPAHYAVVVGKSEMKKWQVDKSLTEIAKLRSKFFETLEEAKVWLASLGYEMSHQDDQKKPLEPYR